MIGDWLGEPVVMLKDEDSGAEAIIAHRLGANCVKWMPSVNGNLIDAHETPPTPEDLRTRRFRAGMPVLFPFPGRVRNAHYTYGDKDYELQYTDKSGLHHIHGLVHDAEWKLVEEGTNRAGTFAELAISAEDLSAEKRAGYPFNFGLTLRFTLKDNLLTIDTTVTNNEAENLLPFSYGLHPYFRAPLIPSASTPDRSALQVLIPANKRWVAVDGIPTGSYSPVDGMEAKDDFRHWELLGTNHYDHMYTDVSYDADWTIAGFRDPGAGLELRVLAERVFREWVLFTQPNRPSLCIEPYTAPPNAINFEAENLTNSGLIELAPAQVWQARVVHEVRTYANPD